MSKPYIFLRLDPQTINRFFDLKIYLEDTPVIHANLLLNNVPFFPESDWTANLAYATNDITHDYTAMEGTISDDYCEFDIADDFFTSDGDYYCQIYLTNEEEEKQIVVGQGNIRVLKSLFD